MVVVGSWFEGSCLWYNVYHATTMRMLCAHVTLQQKDKRHGSCFPVGSAMQTCHSIGAKG